MLHRAGTDDEVAAFVEADQAIGQDTAKMRTVFESILGPNAKPDTIRRTLASLAKLDPAAWVPLRRSMAAFRAPGPLSGFPLLSLESAEVNKSTFSALQPEVELTRLPATSHWLMLDDPAGVNAALDRFFVTVDAQS